MSIATQLVRLKAAKDAIKASIIDKGVQIDDSLSIDEYAAKIDEIQTGSGSNDKINWTGHVDVEGLKELNWDDDDIAYYQAHGVNWNEEDDDLHKVPQSDKDFYQFMLNGQLNGNPNTSITGSIIWGDYKYSVIYFPKINTQNVTDMNDMFSECASLVTIPNLDTHNVTTMQRMFYECKSLVTIPNLDTQNVTNISTMFYNCPCLVTIPKLNTQSVTDVYNIFYSCYSLISIPHLDTHNVTKMGNMFYNCYSLVTIPNLDTQNVTDMGNMFYGCRALVSIPQLNTQKVTNMSNMFSNCYSLQSIKGLKMNKIGYSSAANLNLTKSRALINVGEGGFEGLNYTLNLSNNNNLTHQSLINILNGLATVTTATTLTLGSLNLAKLTDEEKAIATNKGWQLS